MTSLTMPDHGRATDSKPHTPNGSANGEAKIGRLAPSQEEISRLEASVPCCRVSTKPFARRSSKVEESIIGALCAWTVEHQIGERARSIPTGTTS